MLGAPATKQAKQNLQTYASRLSQRGRYLRVGFQATPDLEVTDSHRSYGFPGGLTTLSRRGLSQMGAQGSLLAVPAACELQATKKAPSWPVPANCIGVLLLAASGRSFRDSGFFLVPFSETRFIAQLPGAPVRLQAQQCQPAASVKTGRCAGQLSYLGFLNCLTCMTRSPAGQACRRPC